MFKIETENLGTLNAQLNKLSEKMFKQAASIQNGIIKIVGIGANEIRNTIIISMQQTPKWIGGRSYVRGKSKRIKTGLENPYGESRRRARHYSSMPGNPPAIDTGQLVRSIMWKVNPPGNEIEVGAIGGTVKGGISYARHLEFGTKHMAERPFLKPAIDLHIKGIIKQVEEYTQKQFTVEGDLK
jgi:hypothetical protein